jgi:hypothetical protein
MLPRRQLEEGVSEMPAKYIFARADFSFLEERL